MYEKENDKLCWVNCVDFGNDNSILSINLFFVIIWDLFSNK